MKISPLTKNKIDSCTIALRDSGSKSRDENTDESTSEAIRNASSNEGWYESRKHQTGRVESKFNIMLIELPAVYR